MKLVIRSMFENRANECMRGGQAVRKTNGSLRKPAQSKGIKVVLETRKSKGKKAAGSVCPNCIQYIQSFFSTEIIKKHKLLNLSSMENSHYVTLKMNGNRIHLFQPHNQSRLCAWPCTRKKKHRRTQISSIHFSRNVPVMIRTKTKQNTVEFSCVILHLVRRV